MSSNREKKTVLLVKKSLLPNNKANNRSYVFKGHAGTYIVLNYFYMCERYSYQGKKVPVLCVKLTISYSFSRETFINDIEYKNLKYIRACN